MKRFAMLLCLAGLVSAAASTPLLLLPPTPAGAQAPEPAPAPEVSEDELAAVLKAQAERVAVMKRAKEATICIFGRGGRGGGSGVVISADGFALSNFHVTSGAGNAMKVGMADGTLYDAVIVGIDPVGDVALIKLLGREDFPFAPMGDSDQVRQLDPCFAAGNPFLLASDFQPTVTYGIVSGVHRYQYPAGTLLEYADCIQMDASINPGNSGGPLFNMAGEVVGINGRGSFEKRGRVNVGVGYAISINQIKNFLGHLKAGRIVDHATLAAQVRTDDEGRVIVQNVLETSTSDAYRRGLRIGDELTRFGGRLIRTTNGFKNALGVFPKGWRVPITYVRDGKTYETYVRLAGVHRAGDLEERIRGKSKKQPKGKPKGKPKLPVPKIVPGGGGMPDIVKKVYEARDGYMNYHFNRLAQQRVWKSLADHGNFAAVKGTWTIAAQGAGGLPATFELSDDRIVAALPGGKIDVAIDPADPQLAEELRPLGSGGLLTTLHLWRRFLVGGIDKFGSLSYLGTVPLPGRTGVVDCLIGIHGGATCHFLCDPETGHLLAIEMFPEDTTDPCEIYFGDYDEVDGREVPRRMHVRHGDAYDNVYKISKISFGAAAGS